MNENEDDVKSATCQMSNQSLKKSILYLISLYPIKNQIMPPSEKTQVIQTSETVFKKILIMVWAMKGTGIGRHEPNKCILSCKKGISTLKTPPLTFTYYVHTWLRFMIQWREYKMHYGAVASVEGRLIKKGEVMSQ